MGFWSLRSLSKSSLALAAGAARAIRACIILINIYMNSLKSLTYRMLAARPAVGACETKVSEPKDIRCLTADFL